MTFLTKINMDNFNRDNAVTLRDTLAANADHFDIRAYFNDEGYRTEKEVIEAYDSVKDFVHPCGNSACIAGFAALLHRSSLLHHEGVREVWPPDALGDYLGIDRHSGGLIAVTEGVWIDVFGKDFFNARDWEDITAEDGAALIDAIIGEYDRRAA